ncbi:MAG: SDR family oxidoreductase, partial [Thaumarchaeota archaeon]|nr:SDR family oxidoreductase [Nitrososphaerota archaeon]
MKILVSGGAGYVGSVVIPELVKDGHYVKCLDRFFFGNEYLSSEQFQGKVELIRDDIRWFDPKILESVDIVLDLAALSNDPVGELDPNKTFDINHLGRARVARLSKNAGVKRYILASSASVYGQQSGAVDEKSPVNPLTAYSKANRMAEVDNIPLNDDNFVVTVMRFSSIYGLSPRMRFDLAVNSMALELYKTGKIVVRGKSNTRPFLHIKDAARAYLLFINAPKEKIGGEIFNIGSDEQNYQMDRLSREVAESIGKKYEIEVKDTKDHRSYIAS